MQQQLSGVGFSYNNSLGVGTDGSIFDPYLCLSLIGLCL